MSFILEGKVNGMRPVGNVIDEGARKGEAWHFLSMEVVDGEFGQVYSCQLRHNELIYKDFVDVQAGKGPKGAPLLTLKQDFTGHNVRLLVKGVSAGERTIEDKESHVKSTILQVRVYIERIKDLGIPKVMDDF